MYLLDTHTYYWFITDDQKLPRKLKELIESTEEEVFVSIVSFWEMAIKSSLGKLKLPAAISALIQDCEEINFAILPIKADHLDRLSDLEWIHRDPFDRLLISQAFSEGLTLLTADNNIPKYNVPVIWNK